LVAIASTTAATTSNQQKRTCRIIEYHRGCTAATAATRRTDISGDATQTSLEPPCIGGHATSSSTIVLRTVSTIAA
jgi:hypothetical protein